VTERLTWGRLAIAGREEANGDTGLGVDPGAVVYADPPYVSAGGRLYARSFTAGDHGALAAGLTGAPYRWLLSYDDHPTTRRLYGTIPGLGRYAVTHSYSTTGVRRRASASAELLIASTPAPGCGLGTWGEAEMAA
jgi:site-specific DNA-adenine methylase